MSTERQLKAIKKGVAKLAKQNDEVLLAIGKMQKALGEYFAHP